MLRIGNHAELLEVCKEAEDLYAALTQISRSPEARAYYERKCAQGKTSKEALRCLKRRISDRISVTSEPRS